MRLLKLFSIICLAAFVCACAPKVNKKTINLDIYENYTGHEPEEDIIVEEEEGFIGVSSLNKTGVYGDAVVVVAARKMPLGRTAGEQDLALFTKSLDAAYAAAQRMYRPAGFTYSISPMGAVNPLSDIEVSCVLGEQAAEEVGAQVCRMFFDGAAQEYALMSAAEDANEAL